VQHVDSLGHVPPLDLVHVTQALDAELPLVLVGVYFQQPLHGGFACFLVGVFIVFVLLDLLGLQEP